MIDLATLKSRLRLSASIESLRTAYDQAHAFLAPLSVEDQQLNLLVMERLVLGDTGHLATLKFGRNSWNAQHCCICGVPLEQQGQAVWLISRWENSSIMFSLCELHSQSTFEVDVDLLTGESKSQIGHP